MGNCKFCSIPQIPEKYKNKEMTTDQLKSIIDQISDLGILAVSFTGGEPTLRRDLPEIIHYAGIHNNLNTGLATNGYYLPQLLKKDEIKGLDYLLLSLDFPIARLHNKMRGLKVYNKVIESIRLANQRNINVIISTNVMKTNIRYLPALCKLAEKLGTSIELYPCEDIVRFYNSNAYRAPFINDLVPDLHQWATTVRYLRKYYRNVLTDKYSIDAIEQGGFGLNPRFQNILRCHVAEAYLFIRHNGNIDYPCKIHPIHSYNALEIPIKKIYNSIKVREQMKKHDGFDFCSHCRLGCAIVSSLTTSWPTVYEKYVKNFFRGNLK